MCNAKYSTSLGLKRHKKNHTDPSNIQCTEEGCNYATSRPDNLKHHQQKARILKSLENYGYCFSRLIFIRFLYV